MKHLRYLSYLRLPFLYALLFAALFTFSGVFFSRPVHAATAISTDIKGVWKGQGIPSNGGSTFDMLLSIFTSEEGNFSGTLTENAYNSVVEISGTVTSASRLGAMVTFTDTSYIIGIGIPLNTTYTASWVFATGQMQGSWYNSGSTSSNGTIALTKLPPPTVSLSSNKNVVGAQITATGSGGWIPGRYPVLILWDGTISLGTPSVFDSSFTARFSVPQASIGDHTITFQNQNQNGNTQMIALNFQVTPTIRNETNPFWSGYVASSFTSSPVPYNDITATWTVHPISCGILENSAESMWIGLGSNDLEQIGSLSRCRASFITYQAVYEIFNNGNDSGTKSIGGKVHPNDTITASVHYGGNGKYTFTISDRSGNKQNWSIAHFSVSASTHTDAYGSAECILEAPKLGNGTSPLSHFTGTETFSSCKANNRPIGVAPLLLKYIATTTAKRPKVTLSSLNAAGDQYSFTWLTSSN